MLHNFERDFYGEELRLVLTGYIRTMDDIKFNSLEELITAIQQDIAYADAHLDQVPNREFFSA